MDLLTTIVLGAGDIGTPGSNSADWWGRVLGLLGLAVSGGFGVWVARTSKRAAVDTAAAANAGTKMEIEAEAYKRARETDEQILKNINTELDRCKSEISRLEVSIEKKDKAIADRDGTIDELKDQLQALKDSFERLRLWLRRSGIEIPANEGLILPD